jgi:three-Cys-motif partner protein
MLDALASHTALERIKDVTFIYLFIEQDRRRVERLENELSKLTLPPNADVHVEHGTFEESFRDLVENVTEGHTLVPTFAFIDPFGYSAASMSLTGRFLGFRRTEALFFLPLSFIHRFVGREGQESALTALFDSEDWREAIPLKGEERSTFLLKLFERQLQSQGQVEHVRSFQLRTSDGNDYRLVFATGHERGLDIIKQAMWSVDPVAGTRYVAKTESGQEVLFQSSVDTRPLVNALRAAFGSEWFTVKEQRASRYCAHRSYTAAISNGSR